MFDRLKHLNTPIFFLQPCSLLWKRSTWASIYRSFFFSFLSQCQVSCDSYEYSTLAVLWPFLLAFLWLVKQEGFVCHIDSFTAKIVSEEKQWGRKTQHKIFEAFFLFFICGEMWWQWLMRACYWLFTSDLDTTRARVFMRACVCVSVCVCVCVFVCV